MRRGDGAKNKRKKLGHLCPTSPVISSDRSVIPSGDEGSPNFKKTPFRVGITGSLAAGKSTFLAKLKAQGWQVLDADLMAHRARKKLGITKSSVKDALQKGPANFKKLESRIHREVFKMLKIALKKAKKNIAVEIPLLFETGAQKYFDEVWVIDAPLKIRRARAIKRGMHPKLFDELNARQWSSTKKRKLADHVFLSR